MATNQQMTYQMMYFHEKNRVVSIAYQISETKNGIDVKYAANILNTTEEPFIRKKQAFICVMRMVKRPVMVSYHEYPKGKERYEQFRLFMRKQVRKQGIRGPRTFQQVNLETMRNVPKLPIKKTKKFVVPNITNILENLAQKLNKKIKVGFVKKSPKMARTENVRQATTKEISVQ